MKLLSVNHLSKRYPGFALQQVSFSVYPGRIMGLIGKNGAGKSTTLKSILNMVHPDSGDVKMFGMDFYQHEKECKQQIGVVFGGVDFYPLKKLSSITAVTRRFYNAWDQEKYEHYLKLFDLDDEKKFKELSNGMKVKYLLSLALSHHAKLLILDEPTSGLDYRHMLEVSDNLNRLKEMGKSLFLITHDPELIYKCCTYLLFIQGSKVLWHRPMDGEAVKLLRAFFSHEQETGAVNAS